MKESNDEETAWLATFSIKEKQARQAQQDTLTAGGSLGWRAPSKCHKPAPGGLAVMQPS